MMWFTSWVHTSFGRVNREKVHAAFGICFGFKSCSIEVMRNTIALMGILKRYCGPAAKAYLHRLCLRLCVCPWAESEQGYPCVWEAFVSLLKKSLSPALRRQDLQGCLCKHWLCISRTFPLWSLLCFTVYLGFLIHIITITLSPSVLFYRWKHRILCINAFVQPPQSSQWNTH